jgi:putative flavoprotein involved in K+ transport
MSDRILNYQTIVIGAGQAGLTMGYFLKEQGQDFAILDANERIGDSWRQRWDSLRLFTPARYNGLAGMPYPAPPHYFPTKDEMADYLEQYAAHFKLPVRNGVRVERLWRQGERFALRAGELQFEADNVVVAMANYQQKKLPAFAAELDPGIVQLHSSEYRNPAQLQDGPLLIAGAGNSGSEIAMELAGHHQTWMSGRDTGHLPFRIEGNPARLFWVPLVLRFLFHRVLTANTPVGLKMRPKVVAKGGPLIRVKPEDLEAAGVERVGRTAGVSNGLPVLEDGRVLEVRNVIWCTGYQPGFSWIDLPVHGDHEPQHEQGIVPSQPGLYFVGLHFLSGLSSAMVHGVERDARRIARVIAARTAQSPAAARAGALAAGRPRTA